MYCLVKNAVQNLWAAFFLAMKLLSCLTGGLGHLDCLQCSMGYRYHGAFVVNPLTMFKIRHPAVSRRLRKFQRRFGIAAPKVVVQTYAPWKMLLLAGLTLAGGFVGGYWFLHAGYEQFSAGKSAGELGMQLLQCQGELLQIRSEAGTGRQAVTMEQAAQQQLRLKVEGLERENAMLKEDVRAFEHLGASADAPSMLRIENFRVLPDGENVYRYRVFLVYSPDKNNADFRGRLRLLVTYFLQGKELQFHQPESGVDGPEYDLKLRHYLRREGVVKLPPGAELKTIEARVFQGDALKARKLTQL